MSRRRNIQGVLHNFLGTFTSRYSDYNGYWLFGFLVGGSDHIKIDLLSLDKAAGVNTALTCARRIAVQKLAEQMAKAGLPMSLIREAYLEIIRSPEGLLGSVNSRPCSGYSVQCVATAVTDLGKVYKAERSIFVAPHNPKVEYRR